MNEARTRLVGEVLFAVLLLLLSVFLLWSAYGISGLSSFTSAGSFPMAVTAVMVITGFIIVVQTIRSSPDGQDTQGSAWAHFVRQISPPVIVLTALSILVYMLTLEWLGFVLASYLFLVITMRLLGSERWLLNMVVSAVALGLIYLVFRTAFSVILPVGRIWQGVL